RRCDGGLVGVVRVVVTRAVPPIAGQRSEPPAGRSPGERRIPVAAPISVPAAVVPAVARINAVVVPVASPAAAPTPARIVPAVIPTGTIANGNVSAPDIHIVADIDSIPVARAIAPVVAADLWPVAWAALAGATIAGPPIS